MRGQDSALIVPYQDRLSFFFGDTLFLDDDIPMAPNSMAWTHDLDASDGIDLTYHTPARAQAVLPPIGPEITVWLTAAFVVGNDIYSYYIRIPRDWPQARPLGGGLAVMRNGQSPFERLRFEFANDDPLIGIGRPLVDGDYLYLFTRRRDGSLFWCFLVRVRLDRLQDRDAYEYWTESGWSSTFAAADVVPLMTNTNAPAVHWNDYLQKWVAISNNMHSDVGLSSQIAYRTADAITGPWTEPTVIYSHPATGRWGSAYNAAWDPTLNRDGGRVFYSTATDSGLYNVFLYETSLEHARSSFTVTAAADDGFQGQAPRTRPRSATRRLYLWSAGRTVLGFRLRGDSFFPTPATQRSSLILRLARAPLTTTSISLDIRMGIPNDHDFHGYAPSLTMRETLGAVQVTLAVQPTDTELRIDDLLSGLLDTAMAHPAWIPSRKNHVLLYLTRLDAGTEPIVIGSAEAAQGARLETCYGAGC